MTVIQSTRLVGNKTLYGDLEITPFARRYLLETPFMELTWLRPEGIQVRGSDGRLEFQQVRDRTRLQQIGLSVLLVLVGFLFLHTYNRSA